MGASGDSTRAETRRSPWRPARASAAVLTGAGWVIGLLVTGLILDTPYLLFGYHSPSLHLVLDSVDSCVALLAAYLVHGRFLRRRRLQDLLLADGLFLLAIAGLALTLFLQLLDDFPHGTLDVWFPVLVRTAGAALIVAASLLGDRTVRGPRAGQWLVAVAALLVLAFWALWSRRDHLPLALTATPPPSAQHAVITGHPLLLLAQAATAVSFALASVTFTRAAARRDDALLRWVGPAFALAAFARLNYVLFPSLYSGWLYTGDILRTCSYLLLLVGASREIHQFWATQMQVAVLEDRRRLARELHDGLVQEITFIRFEAHEIGPEVCGSREIIASCDRALDEARAAVDALGRDLDEPLGHVLLRAAAQVADRYGGQLEVDLDDTVTADLEQRHPLARITREAVSNALRHGRAGRIQLRLVREQDGRRLVVADDGDGFDVAEVSQAGRGYGLTSMADRARALPGSLRITSVRGQGTEVEVTW